MGNSSGQDVFDPVHSPTQLQEIIFHDVRKCKPQVFHDALIQIFSEVNSLGEEGDQITEICNLPESLLRIIYEYGASLSLTQTAFLAYQIHMHRGEDKTYSEVFEYIREKNLVCIAFKFFTYKIDENMLLLFFLFGYNEYCIRNCPERYDFIQKSWKELQYIVYNPRDLRATLAENEKRLTCLVMTLIQTVINKRIQEGERRAEWFVSPTSFRLRSEQGLVPVYGSRRLYNWVCEHISLLARTLCRYNLSLVEWQKLQTQAHRDYVVLVIELKV